MEENTFSKGAALVEKVAESFGQAYFVYNVEEGRFLYLNKAFVDLFGPEAEDFLVTPTLVLPFVHEEDKAFAYDQYAKLLDQKVLKGTELRLQMPSGSTKWICLSTQVLEEKGRYIAGFAEDVTKDKEYLKNILMFNSKKNSTLEILSHDLAAPFTNIEGMVEMLEQELQSKDGVASDLIQYIKENAQKGSDIIRDFIDNEFLESAQVVLHKERVNLSQRIGIMVENYVKLGRPLIAKNFSMDLPQEPLYVYIDVMKFMQVLNNLVSNAIKFTPDHGNITVSAQDQGNKVLIEVQDNGIGIPDALKPALFDKFTKARREGLKGEKSVGLGMSIIKTIVELHKGQVWVESQEGQGTTVFVEIPKD